MEKPFIVTPHTTLRQDASDLRTGDIGLSELKQSVDTRVQATRAGIAGVEEGNMSQKNLDDFVEFSRLSTEAREIAAVIIAQVVNSAIARKPQMPPHGLGFYHPVKFGLHGLAHQNDIRYSDLQPHADFFHAPGFFPGTFDDMDPFVLQSYMMITTNAAILNELLADPISMESLPNAQRIVARFTHVVGRLHQQRGQKQYSSPAQFIRTGLGSGVRHMADVLRALPEFLKVSGIDGWNNPEFVTQVAHASTGQIIRGTKFTLHQFVDLIQMQEMTPDLVKRYPTELFEVKESKRNLDGVPVVGFKEEIIEDTKNLHAINNFTSTGCPAGVKLNGRDSSVEKLWKWLVKIAGTDIYPKMLK